MRRVRKHAAGLILSAIDNGDEALFLDDEEEPLPKADQQRIIRACMQLANTLTRGAK
jgi:hypothetical protein